MIVSKEDAKAEGMTHEGTLYGIDVYMRLNGNNEFDALPKVYWLHTWLWLCDAAYFVASWFLLPGCYIDTPMTIGDPI